MTFRINADECTACGLCVDVCPSEAITETDDGDAFVINPDLCDSCANCTDECPNEAIIEE